MFTDGRTDGQIDCNRRLGRDVKVPINESFYSVNSAANVMFVEMKQYLLLNFMTVKYWPL